MIIEAIVTCYCLKGIMANGQQVYNGAIACPRYYEFGTKIEVLDKNYVCADRMNKRFPNRFDIWNDDCDYCKKWGKKKLKINIKINDEN